MRAKHFPRTWLGQIDGFDEFAALQCILLLTGVELAQIQCACGLAPAQQQRGAQSQQAGHAVADGRAVGNVAGQRGGGADRWRTEAAQYFSKVRVGVVDQFQHRCERHLSANAPAFGVVLNRAQFADLAEVDDVLRMGKILVDLKTNFGAAGQQRCLRVLQQVVGQRSHALGRKKGPALFRLEHGRLLAGKAQLLQQFEVGAVVQAQLFSRCNARLERGIDDRFVAGAAAQIAAQRIIDLSACGPGDRLQQTGQAHHDAGRAKTALRAMTLGHGLLHRVQLAVGALQAFHRLDRLAIQRGHQLQATVDAGVSYRRAVGVELTDQHNAGAAVAFGAAFLGAGAVQMLAQVIKHRGVEVLAANFDDGAVEYKAHSIAGLSHGGFWGAWRKPLWSIKV